MVLEDSEAGIEAAYRATIPVICVPDMKRTSPESTEKTETVFEQLDELTKYSISKSYSCKQLFDLINNVIL